MIERRAMRVEGVVQGVGFRPYVYGLACRHGLSGWVLNDTRGVRIEVQGTSCSLDAFVADLWDEQPPLVDIQSLEFAAVPLGEEAGFAIRESDVGGAHQALVTPDAATCDACLRELFDSSDRRYRYPFINCTHCGPRFTIVRDIPYDRPLTTMSEFEMCQACRAEYDDPWDRRFHAQPNACPECGPSARLLDCAGIPVEGDVFERAAEVLRQGAIVAVKGLGGYALACDATNDAAVARLRDRKHREEKPFALMAPDLETAERLCRMDEAERALLQSPKRPIVLLRRRGSEVSPCVAPGQKTLGIMLPYTPLHHLLLQAASLPLVMTSGNRSEEPIAYRDDDALARLAGIADYFLVHDRRIETRCDDSVTRVQAGVERVVRRARGYAPAPVKLARPLAHPVLACGGHLKNTICLAQGDRAFVSHHIGDLENIETLRSFEEAIEHFGRLFQIAPQVVAHDLHPDYLSTKHALSLDGVRTVGVQHHHAHIAACMAEHGLEGQVLGIALDGTGYGTNGTVWGGEVLKADYAGFERLAHLEQVRLPGGEAAVREPWRVAAAWLHQVYGDAMDGLPLEFNRRLEQRPWRAVRQMLERGVNSPVTSSTGRLFDAAASLAGVRDNVAYEGQAAIELEALADEDEAGAYEMSLESGAPLVLGVNTLVRGLVADLMRGVETPVVSGRFHNALVTGLTRCCLRLREEQGLERVVLGGGCFQNMLLLSRLEERLTAEGFAVFAPTRLPANDGGLSLGQAVVADAVAAREQHGEREETLCV